MWGGREGGRGDSALDTPKILKHHYVGHIKLHMYYKIPLYPTLYQPHCSRAFYGFCTSSATPIGGSVGRNAGQSCRMACPYLIVLHLAVHNLHSHCYFPHSRLVSET